MIKKLIVSFSIALMLAGCGNDDKLISETHIITTIEDGNITGANINGDDTGIYYSIYDFKSHGIDRINVDDKVRITWTEENYNNEDWIIESVELVE